MRARDFMLQKAERRVHLRRKIIAAQAFEIFPGLQKNSRVAGRRSFRGKEFCSAAQSFVSVLFDHEQKECYMGNGRSLYHGSELTVTAGAEEMAILEQSSMPDSTFRFSLAEYVRSQARPVDKLGHQPRLYRLTTLIGQGYVYDDDVVYAAAWLHDLGVFIGHRPQDPGALAVWDHVGYTIEQTPAILRRVGFPAEKISSVLQAIRSHQPQATPAELEAIILRDADILEQLGSIGILRVAAKVGSDTRYRTFTDARSTLRKNLAELPAQLRLESAKAIAERRIALLQEFLRELDDEAPGDLF